MFEQNNGIQVEEGKIYRSVVGELVKVLEIDLDKNQMKCFNISEACTSYHRIDAAKKDNKFRAKI